MRFGVGVLSWRSTFNQWDIGNVLRRVDYGPHRGEHRFCWSEFGLDAAERDVASVNDEGGQRVDSVEAALSLPSTMKVANVSIPSKQPWHSPGGRRFFKAARSVVRTVLWSVATSSGSIDPTSTG